jgi:hypothetical protein
VIISLLKLSSLYDISLEGEDVKVPKSPKVVTKKQEGILCFAAKK